MTRIETEIELLEDGQIRIGFEDRWDARIGGWEEATDALETAGGVSVEVEEPWDKYDDGTLDGVEYGVLVFRNAEAVENASDTLRKNARTRPIGSSEASEVQELAGVLPSRYEIEQLERSLQTDTERGDSGD